MVTYVASYGKDPKIAEQVQQSLLNEQQIQVVHTCLDLDIAKTELPALCSGQVEIVPTSGLGTNATAPAADRKVPEAVLFGGNFTDAEYEQISEAVRAKNPKVAFIKCGKMDVLKAGGLGPNPSVIAKVYRKKLDALAAA